MSALRDSLFISEEDYLAGELVSPIKHEYVSGRVYAMSGGTAIHQRVARNFVVSASSGLRGKACEPFGSDLSVRVEQLGEVSYFYPDASVVCSPLEGSAQFTDAPAVVLEVLSPTTRRIDETSKLQAYLSLPSLQVCLLAESDEPFVRVYRRKDEQFVVEVYEGREVEIALPEIEMILSLEDLYRDVE